MTAKVPFIKPKLPEPEELVDDLKRIYKNNYYSNNGPIYREFKQALEEYLGQGIKVAAVANATLGLMLAIQACIGRTKPDKKYIAIPSFTFAAGPLAIKWCGYEPVFFDIDPVTTQPSLDSFKEVLNTYRGELAGAVLINSFGIGNEAIADWQTLLSANDIPFIIDSAPGLGATYSDGDLIGGQGSSEVFSLHATKPFGIGEGGLITTKDTALAEELESLKNFGFNAGKQTTGYGLNAKITELDCAIGLRILAHYPAILEDRRATYQRFEDNLKSEPVKFLPRAATAAIQFATVLVDSQKRSAILEALKAAGVEARTYYAPAVHTFPFFAESPQVNLQNTQALSERVLSLPVHPNMEASVVDYICGIITKSLQEG
ncbi:MAG TPA: DegT/DnrJ/EryC1/StrS family aminotransferase [Candidatus Saccharimonadales bacterium]|nr:DegT/DnrJ/EryC1/StrS family aminotransferase [Candidatus Saccharimonadales bacterium]